MNDLNTLIELASKHAHAVRLILNQEIMPSWLLVNDKGEVEILGTPWRDDIEKEITKLQLREYFHIKKIVAYSTLVEAWAANAPADWNERDPLPPSRTRPDRREVVIAFATDGVDKLCANWEIVRDYNEQVIELKPIDREDDPAQMSGWMTEMLS